MTVREFYSLAGVVHTDNCEVCNIKEVVKMKHHKVRKSFNILFWALLIVAVYSFMFRLEYIVGGLPK